MSNPDEVLTELPKLRHKTQTVVVDGPAGLDEISRAILVHCDGVVVPCKAGTLEARALVRATRAITQVQQIPGREGLPEAKTVLTMVGERFLLTREMREAANGLGFDLAKSMLPQRQAYALAPGLGKVLWQIGRRGEKAARELDQFFRELLPGLDTQVPSRVEQVLAANSRIKKRGNRDRHEQRRASNE